jgi:AraC-like DNA-binding protein
MPIVRHVVRSASLRGYPELARSVGLDPLAMMRRVGLPRRCLDDPETRIGADAVARLLELSAQEADVPDFGLRLSSARRLAHLGPLALALRQEPTGLAVLETLSRYTNLLNTSLFTRVESHGGLVTIAQDVLLDQPGSARQSVELAVGVMCGLLRDVLGPAWRPRGVGFTHRAPRDVATHRALFGVRPDFDARFNGLVCDRRDLEAALPHADPELARWARTVLDGTVHAGADAPVHAVRRLVAVLLPGGRCTVDVVAQHLGVDRRTVHRRLQAHGTTFTALLCDLRREFATRQLADSDRPPAEIAELLGFSGTSAFAHWFRSQFGDTTTQWRQRVRGARSPLAPQPAAARPRARHRPAPCPTRSSGARRR